MASIAVTGTRITAASPNDRLPRRHLAGLTQGTPGHGRKHFFPPSLSPPTTRAASVHQRSSLCNQPLIELRSFLSVHQGCHRSSWDSLLTEASRQNQRSSSFPNSNLSQPIQNNFHANFQVPLQGPSKKPFIESWTGREAFKTATGKPNLLKRGLHSTSMEDSISIEDFVQALSAITAPSEQVEGNAMAAPEMASAHASFETTLGVFLSSITTDEEIQPTSSEDSEQSSGCTGRERPLSAGIRRVHVEGCQGTLCSPFPRVLPDPSLSTRVPATPSPAPRPGPASRAQQAKGTAARTSPQHRPQSQSLNLLTARRPPSDCSGPGSWHGSGWGRAKYRPSPPRRCPLPLGSGSAGHPPCRYPHPGRTRRTTQAAARVRLGGGGGPPLPAAVPSLRVRAARGTLPAVIPPRGGHGGRPGLRRQCGPGPAGGRA